MSLQVVIVGRVKSGKSTLMQLLAKLLHEAGLHSIKVIEPEHTPAVQLRQAARAVEALRGQDIVLRTVDTTRAASEPEGVQQALFALTEDQARIAWGVLDKERRTQKVTPPAPGEEEMVTEHLDQLDDICGALLPGRIKLLDG